MFVCFLYVALTKALPHGYKLATLIVEPFIHILLSMIHNKHYKFALTSPVLRADRMFILKDALIILSSYMKILEYNLFLDVD